MSDTAKNDGLVESLRGFACYPQSAQNHQGLSDRFRNSLGVCHDLMLEAAAALTAKDEQIARLRSALIEAGREAGAVLADNVSTDFLMYVPGEVRGRIAKLEAERTAAIAAAVSSAPADVREALEWLAAEQTTAEALNRGHREWGNLTPEQRLDRLAQRKDARDGAILKARAALERTAP